MTYGAKSGQTLCGDNDLDNFGILVVASGDGLRVASGAPGTQGTGASARVYTLK
jgi:hypothetical protein